MKFVKNHDFPEPGSPINKVLLLAITCLRKAEFFLSDIMFLLWSISNSCFILPKSVLIRSSLRISLAVI